ncbi:FAD-binding protein, partial [Candidatus Pacearchaeota archaeon]|nr:FAD-binding protein [Candidatus Pacearchaeota archaeon]
MFLRLVKEAMFIHLLYLTPIKKKANKANYLDDTDSLEITCDVLVIGAGISGLSLALKVANIGNVIVLTKTTLSDCATILAQAGINAVLGPDDSFESHVQDTLTVGDGLCHPKVVQKIVAAAPDRIKEFVKWGVEFSKKDPDHYDLGMEAGHSHRRVVHSKDITGIDIQNTLVNQVKTESRITVLENQIAVNLKIRAGRCLGAYVLDKNQDVVKNFSAKVTVLATGGLGKAFL